MRRPLLAAGLLALVAATGSAQSAAPGLQLVFVPTFEHVFPGSARILNGTLRLEVPDGAACDADLPYTFTLLSISPNITATLEPDLGAFPAEALEPGATVEQPLTVRLEAAPNATAYHRIDVRVRAETGPCGNLEAAQATAQSGAHVGFLPRVTLRVASAADPYWSIVADNGGNARSRLDWRAYQPALGVVLSGGLEDVPGPEDGPGTPQATFTVAKGRFDAAEEAWLDVRILYAGQVAVVDPPDNLTALLLHRPGQAPWDQARPLVFTGVAVVAVGLVAWTWWRSRDH